MPCHPSCRALGQVRVNLTAHQRLPFDLRYANRRDDHGITLSWRSSTSGMHAVHPTAFGHTQGDLCLHAWNRDQVQACSLADGAGMLPTLQQLVWGDLTPCLHM